MQLLLGAFAMSGLAGVEWGMAVRTRRDVRIGGWLGIILAGSYCTIVSLLTVAAAAGRIGIPGSLPGHDSPVTPLSFHWAIFQGIGGITGGVLLMLLGLVTMAPAVYSAWVFRQKTSTRWPAIPRRQWTRLGGVLAFLLAATGLADRIETLFELLGAVFAPAVGALVADCLRQKGTWRGVRPGWNPAGLLAWVVGCAVALVPVLGRALDWTTAERFQPAVLYGYLAAAATYLIVSSAGLERPLVRIDKTASDAAQPAAPAPG